MILQNNRNISIFRNITILLVFLNAEILETALVQNENWYPALVIALPLLFIFILKTRQYSHEDRTQAKLKKEKLPGENGAANSIVNFN